MARKVGGYLTKDLFDCFSLIPSTAGRLLYNWEHGCKSKQCLEKTLENIFCPTGCREDYSVLSRAALLANLPALLADL